jgi:phage shock protein B
MTRELSDLIIVLVSATLLFVAMPWLFLHYATRWRRQEEINKANQALIGELTGRANRLEERAAVLERLADTDADPSRGAEPTRLEAGARAEEGTRR